MLLLFIASQLAAPLPIKPENWFSADDYPTDIVSGGETAFQSVTQTLIDSTGKMIGCRIETPSDDPKVDALACALILKRGRFEPARWGDGSPVPGIYRLVVSFVLAGDNSIPSAILISAFNVYQRGKSHLPTSRSRLPATPKARFENALVVGQFGI
jgi:hypothetical protein